MFSNRSMLILFLVASGSAWSSPAVHQPDISDPSLSRPYIREGLVPVATPGLTLYVSAGTVAGGDGNRGAPFSSLEAARDALRVIKKSEGLPKGGVEVVLLPGRYPRRTPFTLTHADSGTPTSPVVFRGSHRDQVILSGGRRLDGRRFALVTDPELLARCNEVAHGKVQSIALDKQDVASYFPGQGRYGLVSMDGHLLQLAQWPNRGYHHIAEFLDKGPTTRHLRPGEKPAPYSWDKPSGASFAFQEIPPPGLGQELAESRDIQVEGYLNNDWYFQREPVARLHGQEVQLLRHTRYGVDDHIRGMPRRVRLVNALLTLDEPGEWYVDRKAERLFIWPIAGFEPASSTVTILGGPELVRMEGTEHITLRDLVFENTGKLALAINKGAYNLIAGCTIRNGSGRGIDLSGGYRNGITGCTFYGLDTIFRISGGDFRTLSPCNHFATNNEIHDCRHRGYGLASLSGVGIRFAHNLLYNLNSGIHFHTVDLLMEYNEFYNIGYEMGDFNVAYCGAKWYTLNNIQRYNFVHHLIEPGGYPVGAFRNDDGGTGLTTFGNVFYRAGRYAGDFYGPGNAFYNNIVIDAPVMWWSVKRPIAPEEIREQWDALSRFGRDLPRGDKGDYLFQVERLLGKDGWKKEPWSQRFPELDQFIRTNPWAQTACRVDLNYVHAVETAVHIHGGESDMATGHDQGHPADLPDTCRFEMPVNIPMEAFVNPEALDFNFTRNFQPMAGFQAIPFNRIGLYRDAYRVNTPDPAVYRKAVYHKYVSDRSRKYDPATVLARYPLPSYLQEE